jgi:hypothetical protein
MVRLREKASLRRIDWEAWGRVGQDFRGEFGAAGGAESGSSLGG